MAITFESIINNLINAKNKYHELYLSYYRNIQKPGFRKLLLSMIDLEKVQEKELLKFKNEQNLEAIFPSQKLADINLDEYNP